MMNQYIFPIIIGVPSPTMVKKARKAAVKHNRLADLDYATDSDY